MIPRLFFCDKNKADKVYLLVKHYICHIMKKNNNLLMWHEFPKNDILMVLCNHKTGKVCIDDRYMGKRI